VTVGNSEPGTSRRSRSVMVSFLGAIVRPLGDWMPIAGTVELMSQLGLDSPGVRTAVFRLKQKGWLASQTRGGARGYALTPLALNTLIAGDKIIWHARQPASLDDGWCIVNFSIPESVRSKRDQLRAQLSSLGFGNVGTAMWIAPARMQGAAEAALAELGLEKYSAMFLGSYVGGQDLATLLYQSWDLAEINQGYKDFIERYRTRAAVLARSGAALDPQEAFVTYVDVIDHWRRLPFRDPGLPRDLLADDWSAPEAVGLFEQLMGELQDPALVHASAHWTH
jgi:phenylacetic acid degradation operon negative regulatory protein